MRYDFLIHDKRLARFAKRATLRTFHFKLKPLGVFARNRAAQLVTATDTQDVIRVLARA